MTWQSNSSIFLWIVSLIWLQPLRQVSTGTLWLTCSLVIEILMTFLPGMRFLTKSRKLMISILEILTHSSLSKFWAESLRLPSTSSCRTYQQSEGITGRAPLNGQWHLQRQVQQERERICTKSPYTQIWWRRAESVDGVLPNQWYSWTIRVKARKSIAIWQWEVVLKVVILTHKDICLTQLRDWVNLYRRLQCLTTPTSQVVCSIYVSQRGKRFWELLVRNCTQKELVSRVKLFESQTFKRMAFCNWLQALRRRWCSRSLMYRQKRNSTKPRGNMIHLQTWSFPVATSHTWLTMPKQQIALVWLIHH